MSINNSISVADFLKKENNNLDVFRVIAACLVIVGHSYVLFPGNGEVDLIRQLTGFTYSGALAVKIFFFISGMLVTNSVLSSNNFKHFVVSRFFRIFPALIFVCLVTVLFVGPVVTSLSMSEYFSSSTPLAYFKNNILLNPQFDLPGVFLNNQYPGVVNGSLWTLRYEVGCYLFLLAMLSLGILKSKKASNIIFGIIIIESVLPQKLFTYWMSSNPEIMPLPAYFSFGVLLAVNKDKIALSYLQTIGLVVILFLLWNTRFAEMFFCLAVFSLILNLAFSKLVLRLKIKNDISYGIYLWGFLVQQVLQHYIIGQTVYFKMFISIVVSITIAYISWFLIEKNSIRLGKRLLIN